METRLGFDFGKVRVHAGAQAAESARALNARAYTVGRDIMFGSGQYEPNSAEGRRVLAHELVHVVQQRGITPSHQSLEHLSTRSDPWETEAERAAADLELGAPRGMTKSVIPRSSLCRQEAEPDRGTAAGGSGDGNVEVSKTSESKPDLRTPLELPGDEAADRLNSALDVMEGFTQVSPPPTNDRALTSSAGSPSRGEGPASEMALQTLSVVQRTDGSSYLAKIHGGVVGSLQVCWDCMNGDASLKGWIWAGAGYEAPLVGWLGAYWFGEKTWWAGQLGRWFEPGQCRPGCDPKAGEGTEKGTSTTESGWGIAGFPLDIRPKQRATFSKGGLEAGLLLTPHSWCDADLELIALFNILAYLGPVGKILTSAVDGLNRLTNNAPHFELAAGIDISATFHLCRGINHLLTINRAEFCGGGFVGAGLGLSHTKSQNHGVG
jgi:hypothetical protein